jgi:hypothetical protein
MCFWNQDDFEGLAFFAKGLKNEEHFTLACNSLVC